VTGVPLVDILIMNTVENLFRILKESKVDHKRFEHEPVRTSEEAARVRSVPLKSGVKAMLLKKKEGGFILVLLPADKKIDFRKIEELENTKKLSFAASPEVLEETGCEPGGVPPFGHTKNGENHMIKTYMDKDIFENKLVNFNAGDRSVSVTIKSEDLKKIIDAVYF